MGPPLALLVCVAWVLTPALGSRVATHWMVTENGLVQPRDDSPYELARPYDLLGFLNQDNIRSEILQSYQELVTRQNMINEQWASIQKVSDVKAILDTDSDCAKSGPMDEVNLYPPILDSIRRGEVTEKDFDLADYLTASDEPPECVKFSALPFSMFTFEHLEGMVNRNNLSMEPNLPLSTLMFPTNTLGAFGRQLTDHLSKNQSSWLHYTLASVYWKVKGNAPKAMECSRRAVYYAPRRFKDIALLSMGSVFHRCSRKLEAQTLFSAAVDHAPQYGVNHFALGCSFAMQGDFNSSVEAYDNCIKVEPTFEPVRKARYMMLCHQKLLQHVDKVENWLRSIRANLTDYGTREYMWWRQQALFLNSMKREAHRFTDLTRTSMDTICQAMEAVLGHEFCDLKRRGDRTSLIEVLLETSEFPVSAYSPEHLMPLSAVLKMQTFVSNIERQMSQIHTLVTKSEHLRARDGKIKSESDYVRELSQLVPSIAIEKYSNYVKIIEDTEPSGGDTLETRAADLEQADRKEDAEKKTQNDFPEFEGGTVLYPPTFKVNRHREEFDTADEWPSKQLCEEWTLRFPAHLDTVYPVFLPFENKGLLLKSVLSERIGLTLHEEHPLPWHPPVCREVKGSTSASIPRLPKSHQQSETVPTDHLRWTLLKYVSDGKVELVQSMHEAEIGQRILTAYKKKVAPKWILYTLSSLYWRVRHNNANALTCLASASKLAPAQYHDILHTSLASVLLEVGYVEEALAIATQAYRLSLHEPATNFLLSLIHMVKNNRMAHIFHMRQVVRVDPGFMDGLARKLLYAWSCKYAKTAAVERDTEEQVCFETGQANGQKMSCSPDGENCQRSSVPTLKHHGYKLEDEISTIVRLLDLNPNRRGETGVSFEDIAESVGTEAVRREAARKLRFLVLDRMLKNCGEEGCSNLYPVKANDVHSHSCFFQHLRFWYWLPYLRLESLLQERGIRVQNKLRLEHSSPFKFPDCKAPRPHGDPTLEWLSRVEVDGWRPVADLIEEVTTLLGKHDSLEDVSAMLAYHVDHNGSWLGLLVAGLWCGGFARGACCMRCFSAAIQAAPPRYRDVPLLSLVAVLHMQDRVKEAKHAAYLALPLAPKSKLHLFVVGISHTYVGEYEAAIRMFRLSLSQEPEYAVARACLQATMCLVLYIDDLAEAHK